MSAIILNLPSPADTTAAPVSVTSTLSYLKRESPVPFSYTFDPPQGTPWESGEYESPYVNIVDARHNASSLSVHHGGFELRDAPTRVTDFMDSAVVKQVYYPEAIKLALATTGGTRAFVFDHVVRRREENRQALSFGRVSAQKIPVTNGRIHNDYSEYSGQRRLELVLGDASAKETI